MGISKSAIIIIMANMGTIGMVQSEREPAHPTVGVYRLDDPGATCPISVFEVANVQVSNMRIACTIQSQRGVLAYRCALPWGDVYCLQSPGRAIVPGMIQGVAAIHDMGQTGSI
jgi:hypothetical protein